jgi:Protein of unknown function (DUF2889)
MALAPDRFIDPRHGTHAPTSGTPARRPGSVRRTTTVDATRPDGWGGLRLVGRGRDLLTRTDGSTEVLAAATSDVDIAYTAGPVVQAVRTDPPVDGLDAIVGRTASSGFRAVIDRSVGVPRGSLLYLLLDETPASTLVSGFANLHATARGVVGADRLRTARPPGPPLQVADLCAGWQAGGVIMRALGSGTGVPLVTGPEAPALTDPGDPLDWHEAPPIDVDEMRRARRHDLWRGSDGVLHVDAFFRDSHMAPAGLETVVHEYTVVATVSPDASTVLSCEATPRVLPWLECPQAVDSARRLAGMRLTGLRSRVRAELVGPSTCTHLNDMLRELEDVVALAPLLG